MSDDEREQIGLARTLGHSIGAIGQAIGRPLGSLFRESSREIVDFGRPLHAAGAYQLRRRREATFVSNPRADQDLPRLGLSKGNIGDAFDCALCGGHRRREPSGDVRS
jgi:hypothetical protein